MQEIIIFFSEFSPLSLYHTRSDGKILPLKDSKTAKPFTIIRTSKDVGPFSICLEPNTKYFLGPPQLGIEEFLDREEASFVIED